MDRTHDGGQCQAAFDNRLDSEQHSLRHAVWMVDCTKTPDR
ncbi:hypothetical protein [Streptomyces sp. NPDC051219]